MDEQSTTTGDPRRALLATYDAALPYVYGYLMIRCGHPHLAADLTAETFAAALVARRRYQAQLPTAAAWLFAIAHNKLTDAQRRGYAEDRARRRLGMERVVPDEEDVRRIEWLGQEVDVVGVLASLPAEQRAAVTERVVQDRDYAEMAARENVSEAVMRKRVSRGLATMRARLRSRT